MHGVRGGHVRCAWWPRAVCVVVTCGVRGGHVRCAWWSRACDAPAFERSSRVAHVRRSEGDHVT
eukprot:1312868-Prymnesium_polylepis.1